MKIVNIAPSAPYNDYWGYQDNLLPKYQKKLGHDVTMITTNLIHKDGSIAEIPCDDYFLKDGVRIIRLKKEKYPGRILTNLNSRLKVYSILKELRPDFIFYHGLVSSTIFDAIKYKRHINRTCIIVQDNHLDKFNSQNSSKSLRRKIIRLFYVLLNKKSIRYVEKVYGVTPWRKAFAEDYFSIPSSKTDVLIMGADDEKIDFVHRDSIRNEIRSKYHIDENDFLIVSGGKLDSKKNILPLMRACSDLEHVKLLIFGQVLSDIKEQFEELLSQNKNIIYIGWIHADEVYSFFFAADLCCFPGSHSVLWEQACAAKTPCVFKRWEGMDHVNNGGNSDFVSDITSEALRQKIIELRYTDKYYVMDNVSKSEATDIYLYSNIARKSLECAHEERC